MRFFCVAADLLRAHEHKCELRPLKPYGLQHATAEQRREGGVAVGGGQIKNEYVHTRNAMREAFDGLRLRRPTQRDMDMDVLYRQHSLVQNCDSCIRLNGKLILAKVNYNTNNFLTK